MEKAIKYLASAIVFATVVLAWLYRYDFDRSGTVRNDRWTGRSEVECDGTWMTDHECTVRRNEERYKPVQ